jgi:hypothetical protein
MNVPVWMIGRGAQRLARARASRPGGELAGTWVSD